MKTPKSKTTHKVKPAAKVSELKALISAETGNAVPSLCLIFAGKILKDDDALSAHNIGDGMTVHLVIKNNAGSAAANNRAAPAGSTEGGNTQQQQRPAADPASAPFGLGAMGGLAGMSNLGMGSANFMEMQQRMSSELMSNPDMLRQVMDSPRPTASASCTEISSRTNRGQSKS